MTVVLCAMVALASCSSSSKADRVCDGLSPAREAVDANTDRVSTFGAKFVGERVSAFEDHVQRQGCLVRVIREDGAGKGATFDYRPNRLNVVVDDGLVTSIEFVG